MTEDTVHINPTILYRVGRRTLEAVTVDRGDGHTMIVFRYEAEVEKYRSQTGKYPESEDFKALTLPYGDLQDVLKMHSCTHVAMPEPWTGEGGVHRFEAEQLEERVPA